MFSSRQLKESIFFVCTFKNLTPSVAAAAPARANPPLPASSAGESFPASCAFFNCTPASATFNAAAIGIANGAAGGTAAPITPATIAPAARGLSATNCFASCAT